LDGELIKNLQIFLDGDLQKIFKQSFAYANMAKIARNKIKKKTSRNILNALNLAVILMAVAFIMGNFSNISSLKITGLTTEIYCDANQCDMKCGAECVGGERTILCENTKNQDQICEDCKWVNVTHSTKVNGNDCYN